MTFHFCFCRLIELCDSAAVAAEHVLQLTSFDMPYVNERNNIYFILLLLLLIISYHLLVDEIHDAIQSKLMFCVFSHPRDGHFFLLLYSNSQDNLHENGNNFMISIWWNEYNIFVEPIKQKQKKNMWVNFVQMKLLEGSLFCHIIQFVRDIIR